jgi:sphingosine kinase
LVLLNPFGGTKRADTIYRTVVEPMFSAAGLEVRLVRTERPLHAKEIAQQFPVDSVDAVVTISGDGLFHEILNGLVSRPDWQQAIKIPVGIIPGGK